MKKVSMKKMASVLLALAMVCGLTIPAFAESTTVSYVGQGTEEYTVKVPATLNPGETGSIEVNGTWPSNKKLTVTAPTEVTLTCSLDDSTKVLGIDCDGVAQVGNNTEAISITESISVDEITDAIFGTWNGSFVYTIKMASV